MRAKLINYLLWIPLAVNVLASTDASGLELRITEAAIDVWSAQEKLVLRYHKEESAVPDGMPDPTFKLVPFDLGWNPASLRSPELGRDAQDYFCGLTAGGLFSSMVQ